MQINEWITNLPMAAKGSLISTCSVGPATRQTEPGIYTAQRKEQREAGQTAFKKQLRIY